MVARQGYMCVVVSPRTAALTRDWVPVVVDVAHTRDLIPRYVGRHPRIRSESAPTHLQCGHVASSYLQAET